MNHLLKEHSELKTLKPEMTKIGNMLSTEDFGVFIKNISGFFTNKIKQREKEHATLLIS